MYPRWTIPGISRATFGSVANFPSGPPQELVISNTAHRKERLLTAQAIIENSHLGDSKKAFKDGRGRKKKPCSGVLQGLFVLFLVVFSN
jgi:hypothetical protein